MKNLIDRLRWWLARRALGLDAETTYLVTNLARRDALPAHAMARQRLDTQSIELQRERWNEEELCSMLLWLARYIEEALASDEVTGDDFPEHVIKAMVMKAATLVQQTYRLRSVREDRRYLDSSVFRLPGGEGKGAMATLPPLVSGHLIWLFGRLCLTLRRVPNGQLPAGIARDTIEAYQAACERYVRLARPEGVATEQSPRSNDNA